MKDKKKMKVWTKVLIFLLLLVMLTVGGCGCVMWYLTGKLNIDNTKMTDAELGITEEGQTWTAPYSEGAVSGSTDGKEIVTPNKKSNYRNIVLFGMSGDNDYDENRSDSIIICTIDQEHQKIKLTSILRDTKAYIEGYRPQKINAAYRYGGPWLALNTLNQNFNLDLRDYVTVDFDQMGAIVDTLGGVEINLTAAEVEIINKSCGSSLNEGQNILNGKEAVCYSRIRRVGSDVERSNRQKRVLSSIFNKVKKMNPTEMLSVGQELLGLVTTSLSVTDLMSLVTIPFGEYELVTNNVPDERYDNNVWGGIDEYGEWVWIYDLPYAALRINNIIYGTGDPE